MVVEVFESAGRPKCHATASLRHVRRLESAHTPKKAPPSARGGMKKRAVRRTGSADFQGGGPHPDPLVRPHRKISREKAKPEAQELTPRKTANFAKKQNAIARWNRTNDLQDGHKR